MEDAIFATATVIFVDPAKIRARPEGVLRHALGGRNFEFLLAFLAFVRAAHFWTVVHPGLEIEDDMRELMAKHPDLASLLLQDPDLPAK